MVNATITGEYDSFKVRSLDEFSWMGNVRGLGVDGLQPEIAKSTMEGGIASTEKCADCK